MEKVEQNIQNVYLHNADMKELGEMPIVLILRNSLSPKILAEK